MRAVARPVRASGNQFALLRSYTNLARLHVLQGRLRAAAATTDEVVQATPNQEAGLQALVGSGTITPDWASCSASGTIWMRAEAPDAGTYLRGARHVRGRRGGS